MNIMQHKAKILCGIALFLLAVSVPKLLFMIKLTTADLRKRVYGEHHMAKISSLFFANERLFPLLENKYIRNDEFAILFTKEVLKKESEAVSQKQEVLLRNISDTFAENVFLNYLGVYAETDRERNYSNLDPLLLKIIEDPGLNPVSYKIMTAALDTDLIEKQALVGIIQFLSWKENFSLAEDLLEWGHAEEEILPLQSFLKEDIAQRRSSPDLPPLPERTGAEILAELAGILSVDMADVSMSDNMLPAVGQDPPERKDIWEFWDMSDTATVSRGSFYGGYDDHENSSMRIMCFYSEEEEGRERSRGGFILGDKLPLEKEKYLITFQAKTFSTQEESSLWLSEELKMKFSFAASNSRWKRVFLVLDNEQLGLTSIRPFFRIWSRGAFWFKDLYIAKLEVGNMDFEETWIHVR